RRPLPFPHVKPTGLHPTAGYSHAVTVSGKMLMISDQVALDENRKLVGAGDIEAQTMQVFENLKKVLTLQGATLKDIVRIGVILTDRANLDKYRAVRARYLSEPFPTSTLIIAGLVTPEILVEIEATAVLPE